MKTVTIQQKASVTYKLGQGNSPLFYAPSPVFVYAPVDGLPGVEIWVKKVASNDAGKALNYAKFAKWPTSMPKVPPPDCP